MNLDKSHIYHWRNQDLSEVWESVRKQKKESFWNGFFWGMGVNSIAFLIYFIIKYGAYNVFNNP